MLTWTRFNSETHGSDYGYQVVRCVVGTKDVWEIVDTSGFQLPGLDGFDHPDQADKELFPVAYFEDLAKAKRHADKWHKMTVKNLH